MTGNRPEIFNPVDTDNMNEKCPYPTKSTNPVGDQKLRLVLIGLLCASVLLGCAQIRKVTYPHDYVYLERKELRSTMALLALYLRQLDEILVVESNLGSDQQRRIIEILKKIEASTAGFGGGITTNHLVIDEHIDEFKSDVNAAIRSVQANPPNYFPAGRLVGSCIGCHRYRN